MLKFSNRQIFSSITILCTLSLGYAYYAQLHWGQQPCPLCIAQRVIIAVIGLLALVFALHNPKTWLVRIYGAIIAGFALFGAKVAAHHVWLMNLPADQQPMACGMPLGMLYQRLPLNNFVQLLLQGDAECGRVSWKILGISAPMAVILLCSMIVAMSLAIIFVRNQKN
jgi:disulfide bond formation protein DsbB